MAKRNHDVSGQCNLSYRYPIVRGVFSLISPSILSLASGKKGAAAWDGVGRKGIWDKSVLLIFLFQRRRYHRYIRKGYFGRKGSN